ncbi:hypothetical protein [uncultured Campylobacter sp.]|uniref:hypothetical protein n=1 Tax=uncultured Campylobacter sp. TaxID=218934 RepID=UPI0026340954|nr:hypothetical protein [uncultured Campylobacter sp.]
MLNKLKFIPLILLLVATLSNATEIGCGINLIPKYGAPIGEPMHKEDDRYTYKLAFDRENELYMYRFRKDGSDIEVYHYVRVQNNYEITQYLGYSTQVFYKVACARTFPSFIYPLKKFDVNDDPKVNTAKYIIDVFAYDSDFATQHCKLGYDLANHKCADDCEHITDRELRFQCACASHFKDAVYAGTFSADPDTCKGENINYTPKCCFGCKRKDGTDFRVVVNSANPYADYGCNYDEIDHLYLDDPKKPDDNKTKPDKPDNNNTKPNKPDKPSNPDDNKTKPNKPDHGGGGHSGGGGGGSNPPDKPGDDDKDKDKNGTHPGGGGGGGGNPGDKDDDQAKFDFSKLNELNETVEGGTNKFMKIFEDAKDQIVGAYNRLKKGKLSDFKVHGSVNSCPYTRDFVIKDGLSKKITIDICVVVKDARPVLYFIFYALFLFLFSLFTYKAVARLL